MKKLVLFLLGTSLLLNLALAALYLAGSGAGSATPPVAPAASESKRPAPLAIGEHIWPSLQADALPELVSNLRAAGFPPDMVRAIAAARLEEIFNARMKALFPSFDQMPFWKNQPNNDPALMAAAIKLSRERQLALREALGADGMADDPVRQMLQGRRMDHLPPDKAAEVLRVITEFDDKRSELYATGASLIDREKITALDKAQHDAIARLLTPQELEDFDLRNSNTARQLRNDLTAFNPTEAEFRALFRLRQPFDEQFNYNYTGMPSQELMRQRSDAQRLLNEQIKAALGAERGADYERTTDYNYRQTSQLVTRLQLPPETTNQVWAVQKDLQQRAMDLMRDRSLVGEARTQQLTALQQEATNKLTPLLGGARGMEAYRQYGGSWMQMLQPRPPVRP